MCVVNGEAEPDLGEDDGRQQLQKVMHQPPPSSIRQRTSAYVISIRQQTDGNNYKRSCISIRQHTSEYVISIRQPTSLDLGEDDGRQLLQQKKKFLLRDMLVHSVSLSSLRLQTPVASGLIHA